MQATNTARLNHLPDLSSRARGWGGIVADVHTWRGAGEAMSIAPDHDIVAMRLSGATPLVQRRGARVDERVATAGNVTIHPRGMDSHWSWTRPGSIMVMRIVPDALAEVRRHGGDPFDLPNAFGFRDGAIENFVGLFRAGLAGPDGPATGLRWEALSLAFCAHLLGTVAGRRVAPPSAGGLAPAVLRRVVEHIADRFGETLTLQDLADVAGVSRFHFARLFKASTGESAMAFVERLRLERARDLIAGGTLSLTRIAHHAGFVDQSHFARRFRRAYGQSPGEFLRANRR